eukprot:1825719-Pyramimonas_sp.AAC.1
MQSSSSLYTLDVVYRISANPFCDGVWTPSGNIKRCFASSWQVIPLPIHLPWTVTSYSPHPKCTQRSQEMTRRRRAGAANASAASTKGKSTKGQAVGQGEYSIEYAASSRSVCKGCLKYVLKGDVRAMKMVHHQSKENNRRGAPSMVPAWHHIRCFLKRVRTPHNPKRHNPKTLPTPIPHRSRVPCNKNKTNRD